MDMAELFNKEDVYYLFKWPTCLSAKKRATKNTEFLRMDPFIWNFMTDHFIWTELSVKAPNIEQAEEVFIKWLYDERYYGPINIESVKFLQEGVTRIPSKKVFKENYKFMTYEESLEYSKQHYGYSFDVAAEFEVDEYPSRIHVMGKDSLIIAYYYQERMVNKWRKIMEGLKACTPKVKNVPDTIIMDHINLLKT